MEKYVDFFQFLKVNHCILSKIIVPSLNERILYNQIVKIYHLSCIKIFVEFLTREFKATAL